MSFLTELLSQVVVGSAQRKTAVDTLRATGTLVDKPYGVAAEEAATRRRRGRDSDRTVEQALELWQATRKVEHGAVSIAESDAKHVCTHTACGQSGSIVCINESLRLYGCINSGRHHVCNGSVSSGCNEYVATMSGELICIFSHRSIGRSVATTTWGSLLVETESVVPVGGYQTLEVKRHNAFSTTASMWAAGRDGLGTDAGSSARVRRRKSHATHAATAAAAADAALALEATADLARLTHTAVVVRKRAHDDDSGGGVLAIAGALAPVPEPELPTEATAAGVAAPPKQRRFGMIVDDEPERDYTAVLATVTGSTRVRQVADTHIAAPETYVSIEGTEDDIHTLGAAPPTAEAVRITSEQRGLAVAAVAAAAGGGASATTAAASTALALCGGYELDAVQLSRAAGDHEALLREYLSDGAGRDITRIFTALFDATHRSRTASQHRAVADRETASALRRYYRRCAEAEVRPNLHTEVRLCDAHTAQMPRLTVCAASRPTPARRRRYLHFINTLWRIIVLSPAFQRDHSRFRLVNHVSGTLYMLCRRFAVEGAADEVVVDTDPYLVDHLPAQSLLREWNAPGPAFESTGRVLAAAVMRRNYVSFSKTGISAGRTAIKLALLSLPQDQDQRSAVAQTLRDAYAVPAGG